MDSEKWRELLIRQARKDPWYRRWVREVTELEEAYYQIRSRLPEKEQHLLEDYLMARETVQGVLVDLAYDLGKQHRRE